jgi:hypothetical protein
MAAGCSALCLSSTLFRSSSQPVTLRCSVQERGHRTLFESVQVSGALVVTGGGGMRRAAECRHIDVLSTPRRYFYSNTTPQRITMLDSVLPGSANGTQSYW